MNYLVSASLYHHIILYTLWQQLSNNLAFEQFAGLLIGNFHIHLLSSAQSLFLLHPAALQHFPALLPPRHLPQLQARAWANGTATLQAMVVMSVLHSLALPEWWRTMVSSVNMLEGMVEAAFPLKLSFLHSLQSKVLPSVTKQAWPFNIWLSQNDRII